MEDFNRNPSDEEPSLTAKSLDKSSTLESPAALGRNATGPNTTGPNTAGPNVTGLNVVGPVSDAPAIGEILGDQAVGTTSSTAEMCSFVDQHYDRIFAYCYRLSGRRSDAEDLCQQVFVAAVKHLGQIRSLESAQAWLATTARRMYWQSLRESTRQNTLYHPTLNEPESPNEACEKRLEREDWVHQSLTQLTPVARIIVVMFYFEEKSYQQIAQELDIPIGTVMSRLSRSKELLREALLKTAEPVVTVKATL